MRWALLTAAAAVLVLALAPGASARYRDRYCSPTGDYCTSAKRQAGAVKLSLSTFSFSGRYRLCVKPTVGAQTCKSFPLRRGGDVAPKHDLLHEVWGDDFDGDANVVEVYVGYLRRKIDAPFGRNTLQTVRGAGYRVVAGA